MKKITALIILIGSASIPCRSDPVSWPFFNLNYQHYNDRHILQDSLSLPAPGPVPLTLSLSTQQTENTTLKKYQKQNHLSLTTQYRLLHPFFHFQSSRDHSSNYQMESSQWSAGFEITHRYRSLLEWNNRSGWINQSYTYSQPDHNNLIRNDGLFSYSQLKGSLNGKFLSYHSDWNLQINRQNAMPFWDTRLVNSILTTKAGWSHRLSWNYYQSGYSFPKEEYDEDRLISAYTLISDLKGTFFPALELQAVTVLDSNENTRYRKNQSSSAYKQKKLGLFSQLTEWKLRLSRQLNLKLIHSFREDNQDFLLQFNDFIYRYYLLHLDLQWNHSGYRIQFVKKIEKDYFAFLDPLNFSDNDQLRDLILLKASFPSIQPNWKIDGEFKNLRKKLVYISPYLSINNTLEDHYYLTLELAYRGFSRLTVIQGLSLDANYIYYSFAPDQNQVIRSFDYLIRLIYHLAPGWTLNFSNSNQHRDYGPYLEDKADTYLFYLQNKRERRYVELALAGDYSVWQLNGFVNWRMTDYYSFQSTKLALSRQDREFSGGMDVSGKWSDMYRLRISLTRQHYYGLKYWVIQSQISRQF
ncbi:MAG: hypothetical protein KBA26_11280 [Candidatus Delongbacteria bacterium]|nr:hypothetical protein [Candidatus Delongbacteria bacterium]